ncbi:CinA family nicotinamide mononucleotide deamidase-related protein [Barnesiella intestinihominis]|uniref:CinA family nicotinamide mononucleotide deamidase-related protein n=1 Tax=Barnesiella intestinihominis TaxID=487174 RepID=UPI00242DD63E|nr:CinA family nicotinamide mononucleotide deamidase-related protein [Barnesiella intestinihominis]
MNVEIIVIGDELLIGQVTDTNSGWIARELNHIGWEVTEITTVRDRSREITDALNSSFGRVDVVLMTGGLGPTKDDITKQTLCDYFGGKLVFDESVFANVEAIFRRRKLTMNDSTRNQAYVPNVCTVIQNPVGTAPVMWFERNGKVLVSMPSVPTEMKTVMKEVVISRLREYFRDHSSILHRTCLVKDFTESRLSETLSDFEAQLPGCIKLAYLPTPGVIRLRLTARGDEESYLQKIIDDEFFKLRTILGSHLFCGSDTTLAGALGSILTERGETLATAESCTGGNIAHEITRIVGSSVYFKGSVVAYSNEVKIRVLNVSSETLSGFGAVSRETVLQMVSGVQRLLSSDCAIATSGIAGPGGGSVEKPVGTVWIAVRYGERSEAECFCFEGDREQVIARATQSALLMLIQLMTK